MLTRASESIVFGLKSTKKSTKVVKKTMAYLFGTKRSGVRIRAERVSASEAPHITSRGPTEMQKHLLFSLGVAQFVSKQKSHSVAFLRSDTPQSKEK